MSQLFSDPGPTKADARKVMLATTAYDAPAACYTFSMANTRKELADRGIETAYALLHGNCHVDDARNSVVRHFLASDCDDLVFIDADVEWSASALVEIINTDGPIVGGVYPYRRFDPRQGLARGMPLRMVMGNTEIDGLGRLEVAGLPTGFMRIRRHVLETLADSAQKYRVRDDEGMAALLFERGLDDDGRRIGGDIAFCDKARQAGFKCYALPHLRLGHAGGEIYRDSLAAAMRRQGGTVLRDVCDLIRREKATIHHCQEVWEWVGNRWAAQEDCLAFAVELARKADGPIVETGSGISTILMAAATDQMVFAVEHDPLYAQQTAAMAFDAGVQDNIAIVSAPIVGDWYDPAEMAGMPERFAFGLIDGPPRQISDRTRFFAHLGDKCGAVLCDDAESIEPAMQAYAGKRGWKTLAREGRAMLIGKRN